MQFNLLVTIWHDCLTFFNLKHSQKLHYVKYYDRKQKQSFTLNLIYFLRSWLHIPWSATMIPAKRIKILAKLLLLFSITVFDFMKFLVIFFIINLLARINVFKKAKLSFPARSFIWNMIQGSPLIKQQIFNY